MSDRCTGHCCRNFCLPFSPAQLSEKVGDAIAFDNARKQDREPETCCVVDIIQIHDMVRYLGHSGRSPTSESGWRYTCKNLQPNGDCGIYENRPEMCRSYPYGRPCGYQECTWSKGRSGEHDREPWKAPPDE